ncbi:unnamed protein product [Arabidopsis thaliana]|uniref:C-JID domain-containing protein n=1 Tax=Arabidopsis thaliana TaxID=3702 RepID=A0A5S9Y5F1_ARATH|nr:unnamed protein product [Arabidopsis thaliana]
MHKLNFGKCFKLNQETRNLIIETPTNRCVILPGREVPRYFTHRATSGGSLTIKLNEKPLPTSMRFKACIVLVNESDDDDDDDGYCLARGVFYRRNWHSLNPLLTEHIYTFEVEEVEVTSSELVFEFTIGRNKYWKVVECGLRQLPQLAMKDKIWIGDRSGADTGDCRRKSKEARKDTGGEREQAAEEVVEEQSFSSVGKIEEKGLLELENRVKDLENKNSELEERLSTLQNENQMLRACLDTEQLKNQIPKRSAE